MDMRFYIPISQYLNPTDCQPKNMKEKDQFLFKISCQSYDSLVFPVYKSLAISFGQMPIS
jgi:hypothetical protein